MNISLYFFPSSLCSCYKLSSKSYCFFKGNIFLLAYFNIFFKFDFLRVYYEICGFLFIFLGCEFRGFFSLCLHTLYRFLKILVHSLLKYRLVLLYVNSFFSLWDNYTYVRYFHLSSFFLILCFILDFFSFSSFSSFIFSLAVSNLLIIHLRILNFSHFNFYVYNFSFLILYFLILFFSSHFYVLCLWKCAFVSIVFFSSV